MKRWCVCICYSDSSMSFLRKVGIKSRRCIMSQLVSGIQGWMMLIVLVSAPV